MTNLNKLFLDKRLINKILITISMIVIFRLLTYVPIPFIDQAALSGSAVSLISSITPLFKELITSMNIVSLGVTSMVTASVMAQGATLLSTRFKVAVSNPGGKTLLDNIVMAIALITTVIGSIVLVLFFDITAEILTINSWYIFALIAIIQAFGTYLVILMTRLIDDKGYGKGVSIFIFATISSYIPELLKTITTGFIRLTDRVYLLIPLLLLFVIVILLIAFIESSEIKIPFNTGSSYYRSPDRTVKGHIPMKLNLIGIMPLAIVNVLIPAFNALWSFLAESNEGKIYYYFQYYKDIFIDNAYGNQFMVIFFLLLLTFVMSFVVINVKDINRSMVKNSNKIPGVALGEETFKYLKSVVRKLLLFNWLYVSLIFIFLSNFPMIDLDSSMASTIMIVFGVGFEIVRNLLVDIRFTQIIKS